MTSLREDVDSPQRYGWRFVAAAYAINPMQAATRERHRQAGSFHSVACLAWDFV
jgi:hypothetical protein